MWKAIPFRLFVARGQLFVWLLALPLLSACGSSVETVTSPTPTPPPTRCSIQARAENLKFTFDGGSGSMRVTTNPECTWTAQSEATWVTLTPPMNGQGEGTVQFTVEANGLPSTRTTGIKIEDQRLEISQEGKPCGFRVSSTLETVEAAGGERTIQVTTTSAQCQWTAVANVPWITIVSGGQGDNSGPVTFRVAALSGPQRTGTLTVAGQTIQVEQGSGCSYSVNTDILTFGAAGGPGEVTVTAPEGCTWTSRSDVPWITFTRGATGSGAGVAAIQVAPTDGPPRTGTINVAGRTVTVAQAPGCTYTIDPTTYSAPAVGSSSQTAVRTAAGCAWTAGTTANWIVITAGQGGNGPADVKFTVAANSGPARVAPISIAGQTLTVTQASGCNITVAPTSVNAGAAASSSSVQVTAPTGCAWSAASAVSWITLGDVTSGSGNSAVPFSIAANSGPARQGTLTVGGHTVTVSQASGCTYTVTPPSQDVAPAGGPATASVATGQGCSWTATGGADWITLGASSGTGPGQVTMTVGSNNGPPRTATVTIANTSVTINQNSPCEWTFSPPVHTFTSEGGNGNVLVIVTGACTWTTTSNDPWITVTAGASGSGNGLVQFVVAANLGAARTGSLTIAGRRYEVIQAAR